MIAALTTAVLLAGSAAAPAGGGDDVAAKVKTILLAIREDEPVAAQILTTRLSGLGAPAAPILLAALETGRVPGAAETDAMDPVREAAAVAALSKRSRAEIVQPATALLERETEPRAAALVVRLLGAVGDRRELALLCKTVRPAGDEIVDGELTDAFEAAAGDILKRDVAAATTAHGLLRQETDAVRWSLIRALGAAASEPALSVLASELGVRPEDDVFVLEQMAGASAAMPHVPESIRIAVRPYLAAGRSDHVAKAAACLAAMQDEGSVGELVDLLRHDDRTLTRAAHDALLAITNVRLFADPDRWSRWLDEETTWFAAEFPVLAQQLRGDSAVLASQALVQMAAHPLHRREIADGIVEAVEHGSAPVRRVACSALRQLGAKSAVPYLVRCAGDVDRDLASEARRALAVLAPGTEIPEPGPAHDQDPQGPEEPGR